MPNNNDGGKVKIIERLINKRKCYHCGTTIGDLYTIRDHVIRGNSIHVCETCKSIYHGYHSNVNAYLDEDMYSSVLDVPMEEAARNVLAVDNVFVKHRDPSKDECNALNTCLFLTSKYYGQEVSYFYVESISAFNSISELFNTIDTVLDRDCVFFSRKEGIDTSTKQGLVTIRVMKEVMRIHDKELHNHLERARAIRDANHKPIEITDEFRDLVAQWRDKKISMKYISEVTGMSISTICRRIKKFNL